VIEALLFLVCALLAIGGAIGAATVRNLFHAALLLGLSLAGVAALYLFLEASYLACVQVIVYIGGILVLILFATLFSADIMGRVQRAPAALRAAGIAGAVLAAAIAVRLAQVAIEHGRNLGQARTPPGSVPDVIGHGGGIGDLLVGTWLVPFLAAGFLLTVALVGSVATVKRFRAPPEAQRG
jgi:NADH:ubiquinone oxidoreductase subunit 6 (subunit J)